VVVASSGTAKVIRVAEGAPSGVSIRRATAARLHRLFDLPPFHSLEQGMRLTLDWYRHALST
jgi:nucleoside-diphosphate-sugar epimerase